MAADPTQQHHIEFVNEQEREYFAQAVLGEEARTFLNSALGRYLHGCAKQEFDTCASQLLAIDPYSPEGKRKWEKLKMDATCAQSFMKWCIEVIQTGDNAATMLDSYREGE